MGGDEKLIINTLIVAKLITKNYYMKISGVGSCDYLTMGNGIECVITRSFCLFM